MDQTRFSPYPSDRLLEMGGTSRRCLPTRRLGNGCSYTWSGDHGIDVIARNLGRIRFLQFDQMKALSADHLIGPDEIGEMKGVLLDHPEASKLIITTTSGFTKGGMGGGKEIYSPLGTPTGGQSGRLAGVGGG